MNDQLKDCVVVITGASSGIGKATALAFAKRKASLVLAARRKEALNITAKLCETLGAQTLVVPTDVTVESQVQDLAVRAVERFNKIDVWINNAGIYHLSKFENTSPEIFRQIIETDLFGYVYGVRAVLPHFKKQDYGLLINNASIFGKISGPYVSAYSAAKFGVVGLSESLRQELDEYNIDVCTVLPASIDTPLFDHSANYTGRKIKPMNPVYSPEEVAETMVQLVYSPKREVIVGEGGKAMLLGRRLLPGIFEKIFKKQIDKDHFEDIEVSGTSGNTLSPMEAGTDISGGWKDEVIIHKSNKPQKKFLIGLTVGFIITRKVLKVIKQIYK